MTFYVSVNDMKTQKEFQRIYADVSNTCDTLGISCSVAQVCQFHTKTSEAIRPVQTTAVKLKRIYSYSLHHAARIQ